MDLLNGWTKESVIEKIKQFVPREGALGGGSVCVYENGDGGRCAVGAFIPDNHAGLSFSGEAEFLLDSYYGLEDSMPFNLNDLETLQHIHDSASKVDFVYAHKGYESTSKSRKYNLNVKDVLVAYIENYM